MTLNRREFLQATASVAVIAVVPIAIVSSAGDELRAVARPSLLDALGPDTVRRIGTGYRALVPMEDDARVLHALISTRPPDAETAGDFAAHRTIVIDGWVLARTEARQCALFSLLG